MAAPVNSVAPALSGVEEVGNTLTCDTGTWTGGVQSYTYQWQEQAPGIHPYQNISGATQNTYVIDASDTAHIIRCVVTATNNTGSTSANSDETVAIPPDYLIVEDGTGKTDSNSYASVVTANDYHAKRGNSAWGLLTIGQQKAALIKATDYMTQVYRLNWKGYRVTGTQALDWPRAWVEKEDFQYTRVNGGAMIGGLYYYPSDVVPSEVVAACCELALTASTENLSPAIERSTIREKVGPIEVEYDKNAPQYKRFRSVDNILAAFLKTVAGGASRMLVRV